MSAYIIAGLVLGGVYAISAVGLVLTYTSSRVFNFGHGAIAFFVASTYYELNTRQGWDVPWAALVSLGIVAPFLGVLLWATLFRWLTYAPASVKLVSTIGLYVAMPPLALMLYGDEPIFRAPGFSGRDVRFYDVFGVTLNSDQIIVLVAAGLVAVGLALFLRFTAFGLAIRAVVDSETMSALVGTNTSLVAASSWAMGAVLAGLAGILISPILNLSAINFALLVVASFAAVVIARLNSLTLAFAGALLLGLIQQVSVKYLPTEGVLASGFRPSVPFFVMAVFLLLYSFGGWGREPSHDERHHATAEPASAPEPGRGWLVRIGYPVAGAIVVLGLPTILDSFWLGIVVSGLALAVIFLSYTLVTGEAGIVSLCQVTFAGIGAVAAAQLSTEYDWPVALAMLGGGVAAVPFGIVVAGLAVRLEGLYLALATLAFALLMDNLVFPIERFSQHASGVAMDRPAIGAYAFDTDVRYYYLLLAVFGALALFITSLRRSTTGLLWGALRSAETAAATLGYSIVRSKLTAFALSAFIAGLGGSLLAGYTLRAHPPSFNALVGLTWLAVVVMWGVRGSMGAMAAGLMFMVLPQLATDYLPDELHQMPPLFFGLGAIALAREPRGIVVLLANGLRSVRRALSGRESPPALAQEG